MAQPQQQQQYPQRAYSPLQSPSPLSAAYGQPPPNKRQRLSPNPGSPYNSPSMNNIALPNQLYSGAFAGNRPQNQPGHSTYNTFNPQPPLHQTPAPLPPPPQQAQQQPQMQSQQTQNGNMGPPSKPFEKDRPTDLNELSDVLMGAGVDLKEEEAALLNRQNQDAASNAFGSGAPASKPPYSNHNYYSSNVPGGSDTFYGAGTFNQPAVSYQDPEKQAEAERKRGIRRKAETKQYHLNEPFLYTGKVQQKLSARARSEHVQVPRNGLYLSQGQQEVQRIVYGPDKHERLVTLKDQALLTNDAPLGDILAAISLAAEERVRALLEDAGALAKERRSGSHGVVPPQLLDIANVNGMVETGLPTPGNSAVSPKAHPLKRSYSEVNQHEPPTPISDGTQTPAKTFAPPSNPMTESLRNAFIAERKVEEQRAAKRARKEAAKAAEAATPSSSGAATPLGDIAPDFDPKAKMTKKEAKRMQEMKVSEAQAVSSTNAAVSMQIGGKKPSWMTAYQPAPISNPMLPKANTNTGANGASGQGRNVNGAPGSGLPAARKFDFKEDSEKGLKIQLRDLLFVMDGERKEKRALSKAWAKLTGER
ncbi:MAG: hypothetical protein Q9183_001268 [Haloplaca sp. 2 TL-2023]